MTLLDRLVETDHPVVVDLITAYDSGADPTLPESKWDNQKTWDNWNKDTAKPFDNRPTWDNWNKKK
jgi:hypothetical protein